jgi:UDP-2,4-diacetamido-2,4,6-trideoxy-beta-L-gulopyranose hydrolase
MKNDNLHHICVAPHHSLKQALEVINAMALRITLVVDTHQKLLGVLTDGDVRRALLAGKDLNSLVFEVMNPQPLTVSPQTSKPQLISIMQKKSLLALPVVDENGFLVGLETLNEQLATPKLDNPIFIMAGGAGTRLRPLTENCPKPMLKVGDKPILETIIQSFIRAGFYRFYISTHYLPEIIENYFSTGEKWGVEITYVYEHEPLGTGGALGLLPENMSDLPLIMINGDILTNVDFTKLLQFHQQQSPIATMCVREYEYQIPYGVIQGDGLSIRSMEEKPTQRYFVNAGIYVVSSQLFKAVPKGGRIDMPTLLEDEIAKDKQVCMYPIHEYWLDIGRLDDFQKAQVDIKGL